MTTQAFPRKRTIRINTGSHNNLADLEQVQAVWAAVSADGRLTIRDLTRVTGLKKTLVNAILDFLQKAGYIEKEFGKTGRRVIVPLVTGEVVHAVHIREWATPLKQPLTEAEAG